MPDKRLEVLGVGEDPKERENREDEWFEEKHNLEMKLLRARHRTELWKERSVALREQFVAWGNSVKEQWPWAIACGVLIIPTVLMGWWVLASLFTGTTSVVGGIYNYYTTEVTGYRIQPGKYDLPYYTVQYKGKDESDWYFYTPPLTEEEAQVQLEQLRIKYKAEADRVWRVKSVEEKQPCWAVVRENTVLPPESVSPCFRDYGQALAVLGAFQQSFNTGEAVVPPELDFTRPPLKLPEPPEPEIIEKEVRVPVITPGPAMETTVLVVERGTSLDVPFPTEDVGPEVLEYLNPDNVYFVVPE